MYIRVSGLFIGNEDMHFNTTLYIEVQTMGINLLCDFWLIQVFQTSVSNDVYSFCYCFCICFYVLENNNVPANMIYIQMHSLMVPVLRCKYRPLMSVF